MTTVGEPELWPINRCSGLWHTTAPTIPQCRSSLEADYGVHWRLAPWPHRWRVSYVRATETASSAANGD